MKKIFSKLLIVIVVSILMVFVGCSKDDVTVKNQVTFLSDNYSLSKGYQSLVNVKKNNLPKSNVYEYDLVLAGSEISYDSENKAFSGKGNFIIISLYSLDSESILPGTYTFDRFLTRDSLTIDYALIGIDSDFSYTPSATTRIGVTNGVVIVKKRGNIYTIDFDFYTSDNQQIVGSYSGILDSYSLKNANYLYNNLNFKSADYPLDYATIDLIDEVNLRPVLYEYDLFLTGPGISYDLNLGELVGKGNLLGVKVYSTSPDSLKTGTYNYSQSSSMTSFTFNMAAVGIDYDFASDLNNGISIIKSGTIAVSKIKNNYRISFDVITVDDSEAKGQYYGVLDYHDYFTAKKSVRFPFKKSFQ